MFAYRAFLPLEEEEVLPLEDEVFEWATEQETEDEQKKMPAVQKQKVDE